MKHYHSADLNNIFRKRPYVSKRVSSYDHSGGNDDRIHVKAEQEYEFACIDGPAVITHFWCTYGNAYPDGSGAIGHELFNTRKILLKIYWDEEKEPSVEVPLGDFFGNIDGYAKQFRSEPIQSTSEDGHGCNCFFPMPFHKKARFVIKNECFNELVFYFYLDYEQVDELPEDALYFHASWNRVMPTKGKDEKGYRTHTEWIFGNEKDKNLDGKENYVILDARGEGHYVGCLLNVVNCDPSAGWDWYGEGDDMIFVDGENWPPRMHGTGMEDYFAMAWSPTQSYESLWNGANIQTDDKFKGHASFYRFHLKDPVIFDKSVKVTIEHGHNNHRSDDYTSLAYWYQKEPHKKFKKMLPVEKRLPLDEHELWWKQKIVTIKNKNEIK
jgi:hypothetical protein